MFIDFIVGLKNLKTFFRVIWRFRWWDYGYLYAIMIVAMREMEKGHRSKRAWGFDANKKAREIQIARKTLERLHEDNYYEEEVIPVIRSYLNDIHLGLPLGIHKDAKEDRLRIYKKQERARKEDWERFLKLFRQSERWWD